MIKPLEIINYIFRIYCQTFLLKWTVSSGAAVQSQLGLAAPVAVSSLPLKWTLTKQSSNDNKKLTFSAPLKPINN